MRFDHSPAGLFSYERFFTRTGFETEVQGNSEMAFFISLFGRSLF